MNQNGLAPIALSTWRQDAISRVVAMYDDADADEALVKVKRTATDIERLNALIELCDELYPEASSLVRSSKAAPKTRIAVVLARLNEICLDGREFAAISSTVYDFRDREAEETAKATRKAKPGSKGPASDENIRKVVKATEKPEDRPKPTTRARTTTTKATAKPKARTARARSK